MSTKASNQLVYKVTSKGEHPLWQFCFSESNSMFSMPYFREMDNSETFLVSHDGRVNYIRDSVYNNG